MPDAKNLVLRLTDEDTHKKKARQKLAKKLYQQSDKLFNCTNGSLRLFVWVRDLGQHTMHEH